MVSYSTFRRRQLHLFSLRFLKWQAQKCLQVFFPFSPALRHLWLLLLRHSQGMNFTGRWHKLFWLCLSEMNAKVALRCLQDSSPFLPQMPCCAELHKEPTVGSDTLRLASMWILATPHQCPFSVQEPCRHFPLLETVTWLFSLWRWKTDLQ